MSPWVLVKKLYGDVRERRVAKFRGSRGVCVIGQQRKKDSFFKGYLYRIATMFPYLIYRHAMLNRQMTCQNSDKSFSTL